MKIPSKKILALEGPYERLDNMILYLRDYILKHRNDYNKWNTRHGERYQPTKPNTIMQYELLYAIRWGKYPEDII